MTALEGWQLKPLDIGDMTADPMSLKDMAREGFGVYVLMTKGEDEENEIEIKIEALKDDEQGLDEQGYMEKKVRDAGEVLSAFGIKPEVKTVTIAGEEHPAMYTVSSFGGTEAVEYDFAFVKDGFCFGITVMGDADKTEELMKTIEKI